jgi:Zn-dependent M28 family amino/carboxypeptidase
MSLPRFALASLALLASSQLLGQGVPPTAPQPVAAAMREFRESAIRAHTRFLADDLLEGRAPGTRGGSLAEKYIAAQFEEMGLQPAGDNGTFFQRVPLVGVTTDAAATQLSFVPKEQNKNQSIPLTWLDDIVGTNQAQQATAKIDSEVVFVGHGVIAPEYKWDDYKGLDVRGKTIVMLVDDPPASPKEPNLFGGIARTYYGRWTYKYEIAAQKGAAACILVHTTPTAGYGWNVVRSSWGRENPEVRLQPNEHALTLAAWITEPIAQRLFSQAGLDLAKLTEAAHSRKFKPVSLGARLQGTIGSVLREMETANVVARLEGSDPAHRDEAVLYTAHHDHLGVGKPDETGDTIYNGALDNATGVALLIEMARVWSLTTPRPPRSIIFAAVTAEEGGLRGSEYYAQHPAVAPGKTAVGLNFDSVEQFGRVRNVMMLGVERTTFYPIARKVTDAMSLRIDADEHPEQGRFYRSDHFSLAKVGIPAISVKSGSDYVGNDPEKGKREFEEYNSKRYHQPSDEFDEKWDFSQGVQLAQLGFWLGWEGATMPEMVTWIPGDEFLATREKSLGRK